MIKKGYHTLRFLLHLIRDLAGSLAASARRRFRRMRRGAAELCIGFDGTPFLEPLTGVGGYAWNLLRSWAEHPEVNVNLYARFFYPAGEGTGMVVSVAGLKRVRFRGHAVPEGLLPSSAFWLAVGRQVLTPLFLLVDNNDLFFAPNFFTPPSLRSAAPGVAVVHDCTFRIHPEFLQDETLENLRRHLPAELYTARRVIGVSANTRRDLEKYLGLSAVRTVAILNGFTSPVLDSPPPEAPKRPYLLFVGTLEPRKNILGLLDAYRLLRDQGRDLGLVLVGRMGWKCGPLQMALDRHPWRTDILHLPYLPSNRLAGWYREALVLVFPSFYEGFGLPILEAMAAGCPVVTTPLASMPEVGGDACLYTAPDGGAIAAGVARLLDEPRLREDLIRRGRARAAAFSWETCAGRTLEVLKEAAWA